MEHMLTHWPVSQTWPAAQTRLHTPQLVGSLGSCTHVLLQSVLPVGQRHWPLKHCPPGPQEFPQVPQLRGSAWRKVQVPLHVVCPAKHIAWQLNPVHTWPAWHTVPQLPQLAGSVRATQRLLQRMKPFGHWHCELTQVPGPQLLPHAPQLPGSLTVLVHRPLQLTKPAGQPSWHTPLTHDRPVPQATPQAPQLRGSLPVVTHWPLQLA